MSENCQHTFKSHSNMGEMCQEDAFEGTKFCILHIPLPDKSKEPNEFKRINELKIDKKIFKIQHNDYNFEGAQLWDCDLSLGYTEINSDINFQYAIINRIDISKRTIRGNLYFQNAKILNNAKFEEAEISGNVYFWDVKIDGDVDFSVAKFGCPENGGIIQFGRAEIKGNLDFGIIRTTNSVDFREAKIGKDVKFNSAKIKKNIHFIDAKIGGKVDFRYITIGGKAEFWGACINGPVNFENSEIKGRADFTRSIIDGDLTFEKSNISNEVSLRGANIIGNTTFNNAFIKSVFFDDSEGKKTEIGSATFTNSKIEGNVDFCHSEVIRDIDFEGAQIEGFVKFDDAHLHGNVYLPGADIKRLVTLNEATKIEKVEAQENIYREVRRGFEKQGDRRKADDYFYKEMVARRKQREKDKKEKKLGFILFFEKWIVDKIFWYGTRWYPAMKAWFVVVIACGFLYSIFSIMGLGCIETNFENGVVRLYDNFYFSVVTATTLGYGDFHPVGISKLIASIEAIFGTFMWAAFIAIFARKYMR